jgi:formylmethanofuran dehydrogenase subunit E
MICIDGVWLVRLSEACLYVDVTCYRCKRLAAMSNTREIDGRRYCHKCAETVEPLSDVLKEGRFYE